MRASRNELADILGVSLEGLKTIEKRHKLEERLNNLGYELITKEKVSRNVFYNIEHMNKDRELLNNICEYVFEVNKTTEFTKYFKERTYKSKINIPVTSEELALISNINTKTVSSWDLKLIDKKIMAKDGFFYCKFNKETGIPEKVTKEEYNSYWKTRGILKQYNKLQNRYLKGEITFNEALQISNDATALRIALGDKYIYKIKKYKLNEDNALYIDFNNIIEYID